MKKKFVFNTIFMILVFTLVIYKFGFGQIVITDDELPSKLGTTLITKYDTTEIAIVDVGSAGENQNWNFTQPIAGISGKFTLTADDSAYSVIDPWGQVTIPLGTFDCLRMKSYVFMDEEVTFNGVPVRSKEARVINYNWIVENLGLLVRATSHTGETDDNFTDARVFTRLDRIDALPVELLSFYCDVMSNCVHLTWRTESEKSNYGFEVERKVTDGEFSKIAFIEGSGTSNETQFYEYSDENLTPGEYQYRLKQIDYNGRFQYSDIIYAVVIGPETFKLNQNYPNPFNPITTFHFGIPERGHVNLTIYNLLGEKINTILDKKLGQGIHTINWNGVDKN